MCACVLLIGAGLYLTRNNKQETQESPDSAFVPDLDPDASTQEAKESDPPEGIRIPGYPSITIPADTNGKYDESGRKSQLFYLYTGTERYR